MTTTQALRSQEGERVQLETIAELTGFPVNVIKKELLLDCDNLEMSDLRKTMMIYLNTNFSELEA